jgi:hypothetical protein
MPAQPRQLPPVNHANLLLATPPVLVLMAAMIAATPNSERPPDEAAAKIAAALPDKAPAPPAKPRRLLVFSVTNGFRHASIPTGKVALAELGRKTGAFEAVISDDLAEFEPGRLATYDAVCFLNTTMDVFMPHPQQLKRMSAEEKAEAEARADRLRAALRDFVHGGRGFVGIHAATDTLYNWAEYGRMIGGYFDGHPWTADTPVSVKVEPGREHHPLVAMFGGRNLNLVEEIYQLKDPYDSSKLCMLLRLDTERSPMDRPGIKRTDGDFGIAWARRWGSGRVFYCSLGHNHHIYWHPTVLRHYLAGIQWALGDLAADVGS